MWLNTLETAARLFMVIILSSSSLLPKLSSPDEVFITDNYMKSNPSLILNACVY